MKNFATISTGCLAVLLLGFVSHASAQPPQAPKPGPEHQKLGYFVGTWTINGEMKPGPFGAGGKMSGTSTCEWFEGRFAVICRGSGQSPMGSMKEVSILSYSTEEKVYTYYGVESSGMTMTTVPKGTVQGDTWTFIDEGIMGGQKMKGRVTLKEVSPTEYTFTMEFQGPDGKWTPLMESRNTKSKS
jgi:hypothetical protein